MNSKRQRIEKLIYDTFDILDPRGVNTNFYKNFFKNMKDPEFDRYMKNFFADDSQNFYLEVQAFVKGGEPTIQDIKKAADYLQIPLNENIWMPYANPNGEPVRTVAPVPVGLTM